jgi:hypothetical protein
MSGAKLLDHWSPPDGAGPPIACLATTFTFEADFFAQDCLSRFLSLSTIAGEGDHISSIAAALEEEDRLSETQVSVLVDWSSPAEKRNLRWDILPVAVPGGLLHAKVVVLLWERSARIVLLSANLTSAGYRRQVELAMAIDLEEGCQVQRSVLNDFISELRHLTGLIPGSTSEPKRRAMATIDQLEARVEALKLSNAVSRVLRLAVAPARPSVSPLDRLADVWRGGKPLWATALSPFWDDQIPASAVAAIRKRLTGLPASSRTVTLVAAIDPFSGTVQAPLSLASQGGSHVVAFDPPDTELRSLHAKLILFESEEWLAALIGSSNATEAGLGLNPGRGHHELNIWLGCPSGSKLAKHLRALSRAGERIEIDDAPWESIRDDDEPTAPVLPTAFLSCTIDAGRLRRVRLELNPGGLPPWWEVQTPSGRELLTSESWRTSGSSSIVFVDLPDEVLPAYLLVRWDAEGESNQATWTANVEDRSALPLPAELRELPPDLLLDALASTRPLPFALERELRRRERAGQEERHLELDPLRRFDDTGLLLQRARHLSLALWRLQERLGRPASSLDAVHWRLHGVFGPLAIADSLVRAAREQPTLPGEAHFRLAEVALTVSAVDWSRVAVDLDLRAVRKLVADALTDLEERRQDLPPAPDAAVDAYVRDAVEAARR